MYPSMAIIRGRKPIENKINTREEHGAIDLALESLNESSQDLLASGSLHSPVNRSHWRVSQTPTSSTSDSRKKRSSYIEKPRVTLKETEDRRMTVQEALDSAIQITPASPSSRRRQFLQKQKLYYMEESQDDSLRDANKWNTFHDSGERIVANVINSKARIAAPETPTGRRDSTRTATTQASSQSTITSFGDHSQLQSPYFRPRQPSNSFLNGSSPSSVQSQQKQHQHQQQQQQQQKLPGRSKSVDSLTAKASGNLFPRTKPPISKSTRNLMAFATPEKETRLNGKSNMKKSLDDGLATTSLVLPDKAPSTPQARQSKPPLESVVSIDVSPWLKGCNRDGDGSSSKALTPPIRVPMKHTEKEKSPKQTAATKKAPQPAQLDEKPNLEDSLQITYTPDTINRTVEEQRALAKEMADQLSRLPDVSATPEQQKAQSWVVAERESANQQGQRRADFQLERSPSLRSSNSRPRWTARRINSTRSLVHKRDSVPSGNVSSHSRGSVSRTRSYSPTSTPSYHSRTDRSNLSGHGGRSISRSPSHSPNEPSQRKKSGRRSAPFRRRSVDTSQGLNARGALASKYVQAFERRASRHGEKLEHEMSIHVTERFIDEEGRAVDIEVKSTLKDGKSEQKERTALQRRRLERRQHMMQPGGRREATSQREARTYSRPEKTSQQRHHSHSPTRNASMDSQQHQVSTPQRFQLDSSIEADDSPTTLVSTSSKQADEEEINENSHQSPSKSTLDDEVYTSVVPEDSNPLNAPDHSSTLFECSLNGNHQVIDLRDWDSSSTSTSSSSSLHSLDSSSHHSTCSVIMSPRKRTVPIDPDGDMCQDSALPPSIRIESSESTIQNHDSSLALDHVIDHMDVVQDLERLARIKAEAAQQQILARQLQAKERLMQVINGKVSMEDFSKRYHLTKEDAEKLVRHIKLSLKTKEDIRWDLAYQILQLLPEKKE
ncbi:hypothetical protein IV203_013908 [Nitzschia inconspicua]|uniref:Uncharacterized protein n=1 Tax=Nitzschia inconspicua TaxID=303405 RepID=A0A9K3M656_9STRA|nr:hypothetical protein IV203_013908 [Nitzschia inconspicua]